MALKAFQQKNVDVELLCAACDQAADVVILADADGMIEYVNHAVERLLGHNPTDLIGTPIRSMIDSKAWPELAKVRERLFAGDIDEHINDRLYVAKNGERILCQTALSVIRVGDEGEAHIIGSIRDVRKERETSANLKRALDAAEDATRLKSEFLANMSHEIRTPLNGVFGMAQALDASSLDAEQREYVEILIDSGKTLLTLLNDILDLSKIEAGKLDITIVETDLRHKLRRICAVHEAVAREKGLDFRSIVSPSVPARLMFDPIRFRQCVDNLLSNAIKFTKKGHVCLSANAELCGDGQHLITISISDTGDGIPEDKQQKIFEAFQQADTSTSRDYGGTGLGLPICRKLAGLMGGDLSVSSAPGQGSTFTLTIRAEAVAVDAAGEDEKVTRLATAQPLLREGLAVLVADDNEVNLRVVDLFLKRHGVATTHARDGQEVLDLLVEAGPFDLILMDIQMPKMDGVAAFKQIRESTAPWREIPVIALTADAMTHNRDRYIEMGMQGYLAKPVNQRDLVAEIARVCPNQRSLRTVAL